MSRYVKDPNNSNKLVPGAPPANAYDRAVKQAPFSASKTPN